MGLVSMAGTGKAYTALQARRRGDVLHVQGEGCEANRCYGVAFDIPKEQLGNGLWEWMRSLKTSLTSLAGTGRTYFRLQARQRDDQLHFQVEGMEFNRCYGAAFDLPLVETKEVEKVVVETVTEEVYPDAAQFIG